jgi:very-short-patch-repair endonuclease
MPPFVQQRRITVAGERFALDAAYDDVLLAVEMDGAAWAWHGSRRQREDDIRRDALLATIGWQTLRFGYARMTSDAVGCQHDVRSTHAARRRLWWALRPGSTPGTRPQRTRSASRVRGAGPPASR